jgi:hypothetical protein
LLIQTLTLHKLLKKNTAQVLSFKKTAQVLSFKKTAQVLSFKRGRYGEGSRSPALSRFAPQILGFLSNKLKKEVLTAKNYLQRQTLAFDPKNRKLINHRHRNLHNTKHLIGKAFKNESLDQPPESQNHFNHIRQSVKLKTRSFQFQLTFILICQISESKTPDVFQFLANNQPCHHNCRLNGYKKDCHLQCTRLRSLKSASPIT